MRLLLDTHVLVWSALVPSRLSLRARDLISDPENDRTVSSASAYEIEYKRQRDPNFPDFRPTWMSYAAPSFSSGCRSMKAMRQRRAGCLDIIAILGTASSSPKRSPRISS